MPQSRPDIYLITPPIADVEEVRSTLEDVCSAAGVTAVLLRLVPSDERSLVNGVKRLAPIVQRHGAAAIVAEVDPSVDLATIVTRGGADGGHVSDPGRVASLRNRLGADANVGAEGLLTKHDAMLAGEAGADYILFGEPCPDGSLPPLDLVEERAGWWAEIFQTPCVAYAPAFDALPRLAATGAEFIALGDVVWNHPEGPAAALAEAARLLAPLPENAA